MSWLSSTSDAIVHAAEDGGSQATQGAEQAFGAIVDAATAAAPPPPTQSSGSSGNFPGIPNGTQQTILATASQIIDSAADLARSAGDSLGDKAEAWASPGLQGLAFGARKLEQFAEPGERGLDLWVYAFEAGMTVGISGLVLGIAFAVRGVEAPAAMVVNAAGRLVVSLGTYLAQQQKSAADTANRQFQSELSRLGNRLNQLAALLETAQAEERKEANRLADAQQGNLFNAMNRAAAAIDALRRTTTLNSALIPSAGSPRVPGFGGSSGIPLPYPNLPQRTNHFDRLDNLLRQLVPVLQSQPQGPSRAIGALQEARKRLTANLQTITQVQQQMSSHPKIVHFKHP